MAKFKSNRRGEKKQRELPACTRRVWTDDLVMKPAGGTGRVSYDGKTYLAERLRWESSRDSGIFREPQPSTRKFRRGDGFTAAGRDYDSLRQLRVKQVPEESGWYEDQYGREVLYLAERKYFAMDIYDTLYDNRCLRWYFIRENHKLTRIYSDDESSWIYVTEDVQDLEYDCWREMKNRHYFG